MCVCVKARERGVWGGKRNGQELLNIFLYLFIPRSRSSSQREARSNKNKGSCSLCGALALATHTLTQREREKHTKAGDPAAALITRERLCDLGLTKMSIMKKPQGSMLRLLLFLFIYITMKKRKDDIIIIMPRFVWCVSSEEIF